MINNVPFFKNVKWDENGKKEKPLASGAGEKMLKICIAIWQNDVCVRVGSQQRPRCCAKNGSKIPNKNNPSVVIMHQMLCSLLSRKLNLLTYSHTRTLDWADKQICSLSHSLSLSTLWTHWRTVPMHFSVFAVHLWKCNKMPRTNHTLYPLHSESNERDNKRPSAGEECDRASSKHIKMHTWFTPSVKLLQMECNKKFNDLNNVHLLSPQELKWLCHSHTHTISLSLSRSRSRSHTTNGVKIK